MSKEKGRLSVGDEVYEVLIYKIRKATVTSTMRARVDGGTKPRVRIYRIQCEDGTPSPRYYESDIGKVLFTSIEDAEARLEENLHFRSLMGGRDYCYEAKEFCQGDKYLPLWSMR